MGTCAIEPEILSKKLMKGLVQGRDSATQLRTLLCKPFGDHGSVISAEELAEKILTSFDETISLLTISSSDNSDDHGALNGGDLMNDGHGISPEPLDHHSHCDDRSSEEYSGESSKKRSAPALKDRRGCYKRRKSSQSWTTIMPTIEDGQAWRKYGQKEILNSQYPRAYFRCTRKNEQGCRATKQVQQIQDNPKMYQTTYIGQHTCKHILKAPQMIVDNSEPYNFESLVNNYKASTTTIDFDHHHSRNKNGSGIGAPTLMEEEQEQDQVLMIKEEAQISEDLSEKSSFDTEDLWSDFKDIELSDPSMGLLSPNGRRAGTDHDQGTVDSIPFSFVDRISMDIMIDDFVVKSIDFRDFDEAEFPLGSA